jgi:hypothetical protein
VKKCELFLAGIEKKKQEQRKEGGKKLKLKFSVFISSFKSF